ITMTVITAPVTPTVSITALPGSTVCSGTGVTFTATPTNGGATPSYQWRKNGGNVGSNSASYVDNGLVNGDVVDVVMTTSLTCVTVGTATSTGITMTVNPLPTITVGSNPSICAGATTTSLLYSATTGSPDQYSIDFNAAANTAGFVDVTNAVLGSTSIGIAVPATVTAGTTYSATLTVRNSIGGCVSAPSPISVIVFATGNPLCGGGSINCGAFTITVTDTRPTCNSQNNGQIIIAVSGGSPNYTVTLSDSTIGYNRALVGNGPFVFGNPLVANGGLSPSLNYKYTVLDQAGNTCTQPYSLPVQSTVQAVASNFVDAPCNGQSTGSAKITITSGGTPPYEYSINGGTTFIGGLVSGNTINNLPPNGTYNILVRDDASDQCPATVSVTINNANAAIAATVTSTSATCASNDGSIIVTGVIGGVSPYTYQLNGNPVTLGTGGQISNLVAGNYTVSILDALLCKKDFPIAVVAPGFVNTTTPVVTQPDCLGQAVNGSISFTILSSGTFTVGYTTDPVNQPTVFVDYGTPNILLQGLSNGDYYVWIKPTVGTCATKLPKQTIAGSFSK
ncbi:MAG: hypothetical protein ACKO13_16745, partial [Cytophagales bacterium]